MTNYSISHQVVNVLHVIAFFLGVCDAFQAPPLLEFHTRSIHGLRRTNKGTAFQVPRIKRTGRYASREDEETTELQSEDVPLVMSNWTCPLQPTEEPLLVNSLDGRLLCASKCAYSIEENEPYFRSISFLPGSTVKIISRGVNSVLVGRTVDGIVLSFRGTVSSSPLDWLQNAALFLKSPGDGIEGKVHAGFYSAVKALWAPLKDTLKDMITNSEQRIFLTGHSKGGSMASIAAMLMQRDKGLPDPAYVCSFAAPKVGNADFATVYNSEIKQTSYEAYLDLIPLLPPSRRMMESMGEEMTEMINEILWSDKQMATQMRDYQWEYEPVGARTYIDNKNGRVPVTREIDDGRIREIERETFLSFAKFRAAHCPACPGDRCDGRYFSGVAASVCTECSD